MRFGIIGTGRITRRLVPELQSTDGVSVTAIASRALDRGRWSADQYGIAQAFGDYQSLLDSDDVDAVYIALPPSLHHEWCQRSLEAGKHVLCEKPFVLDLNELQSLVQLSKSTGLRLLDATAWLHHPRTELMKEQVASGKLGELRHLSAAVSFFEPFQHQDHRRSRELGGGCVLDLAWYAAGNVILGAGMAPQRVMATAVMRDGVPFRASALLWFANEITATINCAYDTATRKWFEWAGSEAAVVCDDFTRPWAERPTRFWIHDRAGSVQSFQVAASQERELIRHFVNMDSLDPYLQQALWTQATVDAIQQSIVSGQPQAVSHGALI